LVEEGAQPPLVEEGAQWPEDRVSSRGVTQLTKLGEDERLTRRR
jgi:hypothetical protein